jgi:hypothetical protein
VRHADRHVALGVDDPLHAQLVQHAPVERRHRPGDHFAGAELLHPGRAAEAVLLPPAEGEYLSARVVSAPLAPDHYAEYAAAHRFGLDGRTSP